MLFKSHVLSLRVAAAVVSDRQAAKEDSRWEQGLLS